MIRFEDITLLVGGREIVSGASWHVRPGDKAGLTGRSGSGKTSLLRAILGEIPVDGGRLWRRAGLEVACLPQEGVAASRLSVWDEARSEMRSLQALEARVSAAERAVELRGAEAADELAFAVEAFRMAGGFAAEERIGGVLRGLGFARRDWDRPCDQLSGGWQMRVALARVLLSTPDLMLLDEPSNHLDLQARSWLARHLSSWPGAVVVVSHDRHLLDAVSRRIVELRGGRLHVFTGNWSAWQAERDLRHAQDVAAWESQQREIERLSGFVNRFRAKATKASQARSRQKELDRMVILSAPETERRPRLRFAPPPPSSAEMVALRKASVGWTREEPLLRALDLSLQRGMRLALVGPNGCGKSTLLSVIEGSLAPLEGSRVLGTGVSMGLYAQASAQDLPEAPSALDFLLGCVWRLEPERGRMVLGALGLSGDTALRPVGSLSGGERARVALARLALGEHNLLLLDEPTNHLDLVTTEVLARALAAFEGAVILVTHVRYLVETVATHVGIFRRGGLELREGVRDEDFDASDDDAEESGGEDASRALSQGATDHAQLKRRARDRERQERRAAELAREIEEGEAAMREIDQGLLLAAEQGDYRMSLDLARKREALEVRVEALFEAWAEAEAARN